MRRPAPGTWVVGPDEAMPKKADPSIPVSTCPREDRSIPLPGWPLPIRESNRASQPHSLPPPTTIPARTRANASAGLLESKKKAVGGLKTRLFHFQSHIGDQYRTGTPPPTHLLIHLRPGSGPPWIPFPPNRPPLQSQLLRMRYKPRARNAAEAQHAHEAR